LDVGRKELTSSALSVSFFSRGRTTAAFRYAGNTPSRNDALQILASVSASSGNSRFISSVFYAFLLVVGTDGQHP